MTCLLMPEPPDPTPAFEQYARSLGWQTALVVQSQLLSPSGEVKYREFEAALDATPATWIALDIENPPWLDRFALRPKLIIDEMLHAVRLIHDRGKKAVLYNEITIASPWAICKDFMRAVDAFSLNCYFHYPWEFTPGQSWWDVLQERLANQQTLSAKYGCPIMAWTAPFSTQHNEQAPRIQRVPAESMLALAKATRACEHFAYWTASRYYLNNGADWERVTWSEFDIDQDYEAHVQAITQGRAA